MSDNPFALTPREREVLELIWQGRSTKEYAAQLGITLKTGERHRDSIRLKMAVHDTVSMIRTALMNGYISL